VRAIDESMSRGAAVARIPVEGLWQQSNHPFFPPASVGVDQFRIVGHQARITGRRNFLRQ
jgi:hypothetical protein